VSGLRLLSTAAILLMLNLSALVDTVLHPDIPYFDTEHLVVGGVTALCAVALYYALTRVRKGLAKAQASGRERERAVTALRELNAMLERGVAERTMQLSEANDALQRRNEELGREIAERKRAEVDLAQASQLNELVLSSTAEGILGLDSQGRHTFGNKAATRMLGYEAEELLGRPSHGAWHHTKSDGSRYPEAQCPIYAALRDGTVHRVSTEVFWRKDGTSIPAEYASTPIHERDRLAGAVVTFTDITARKDAEDARDRLQVQLLQAQKAESLGRMAGAIAHHFNNILSVILLNLELAKDELPSGSEVHENVAGAIKASERAVEISQQMLAYVGQDRGTRVPTDLGEACRTALNALHSSLPRNTRLKTDFPATRAIIQADAAQMKRILTQLVLNASEAIGDGAGSITVTIGVVPAADVRATRICPADWQPRAVSYACLSVADTGGGMTPETLERAFDPFFSTKFTGRGLGLPVVMGIVQAHDGACAVESSPAQGTTVRIFLPVIAEPPLGVR